MAEPQPIPVNALPSSPVAPLPVFRQGGAAASENDLHELRVRIPVDLHRQLLSLKVLRGRSLAETVALALDIYFANHAAKAAEQEQAERAEPHPSS
jgi:hypothetical protein